jgi:glycosyltransferase involved in cell wall biosynthesis
VIVFELPKSSVRVLFCCTGVGIFNRGIESFFREAFDGLKGTPGLEARLIKGANDPSTFNLQPSTRSANERTVWCLKRTGWLAPLIGKLTGRSAYAVEQWSSFPGIVRQIREFRPHVVFTSEANLMFLLRRFRRQIGVPFRVLYSNGGPVHPPFNRHDVVHQVAPFYRDEALAAGEPPEKHFMVPYGIHVPGAPVSDPAAKRDLRLKLGLPVDRPIVLSVGWIARQHKRMDYVIEEVARATGSPLRLERGEGKGEVSERPFLQLLGAMDEHSPEIVELGNRLLGPENFSARSVPYTQVADYYRAADVFVLGSLKEGFGRVYLEALMHGLPTIGHKHPVIEWVLGDVGITAELSQPGNLASVLADVLSDIRPLSAALGSPSFVCCPPSADPSVRRWESVRDRFSWPVLAPHYIRLFQQVAAQHAPKGARP